MKTLFATASSLALAALLLPAQAQTPAPTPAHSRPAKSAAAKPAAQQDAAPKLAPGTDPAVGRKFMEKSKPDVRPVIPGKVRPRGPME